MGRRLMTTSKVESGKAGFSIKPTSKTTPSPDREAFFFAPSIISGAASMRYIFPFAPAQDCAVRVRLPMPKPTSRTLSSDLIFASSVTILLLARFGPRPRNPVRRSYRKAP